MTMEIKKTVSKFSYRIEEKPGGGYVAHPGDAAMETLEGATREEVLEKVRAKTSALIGEQIPASLFKIGGLKVAVNRQFTIKSTSRTDDASLMQEQQGKLLEGGDPAAQFSSLIRTGEGSNAIGTILRVAAALLAIGALVYYFLHR